jgi:ADP-ribose pyrophosphatase
LRAAGALIMISICPILGNERSVMSPDRLLLETSKFRVYERQYASGAGTHRKPIVVHPGAICVLPLLDDGRLVLIRNHRVAVDEELIELPAGTLEPGEEPLETARRELREETGYRASSWQFLTTFWMSPGILQERMHLFLATGLVAGAPALDQGERIRTLIVDWEEALRWVRDGEIQDAKTIAGLLFYRAFHEEHTC